MDTLFLGVYIPELGGDQATARNCRHAQEKAIFFLPIGLGT